MKILLGICGGVAAYKSAELVRLLRQQGANVQVVMTESAKQFITPLTLQSLSGLPVRDSLFDTAAEAGMSHIELARFADKIIIAPASANCLARLAQGMADDLLSTVCLATPAPISVAPAMNQAMWRHPATQANVALLQQRGYQVLGPAEGEQACGDVGPGRMLEPSQLIKHLLGEPLLAKHHVVITAGPTREAIDPVRFLSNPASGKMGFALATAAARLGAKVSLVAGPVDLPPPAAVDYWPVTTANDMHQRCMQLLNEQPVTMFIGTAAVANYAPMVSHEQKLSSHNDELQLNLRRTPDIISAVAAHERAPFTVGFAAQTDDVINKAREKLVRKNLDMIIANHVGTDLDQGFASDHNSVHVLWRDQQVDFPRQPKQQLAESLLHCIKEAFDDQQQTQHSS